MTEDYIMRQFLTVHLKSMIHVNRTGSDMLFPVDDEGEQNTTLPSNTA
jgi:hypothetical protein